MRAEAVEKVAKKMQEAANATSARVSFVCNASLLDGMRTGRRRGADCPNPVSSGGGEM
jgi:hypothetical protein